MNNIIQIPNKGALLDYRTFDQKAKDWRPEEAFAPSPVIWKEKTDKEIEDGIKAHSISQGATSRCVSEYAGIALEWAEFIEGSQSIVFSRRDIYARRANLPAEGMSMPDLFKLMKEGACLESQLPSTQTREADINAPYIVTDEMLKARSQYGSLSSFTYSSYTIDDIARMIDQDVPVCIFWYFAGNEWWNSKPEIKQDINLYSSLALHHQATVVGYKLVDGVKTLVVMDSAGQGTGYGKQYNLRDISESFFNKRAYGAGFAIDKKNLDYVAKPFTYYLNMNLKNGDVHADVEALQKILILEGCLSLKTPTKNYFGMTQSAVKKLQEKYASEILAPLNLKQGTGIFGNSTRAFINKKYSK